MNLFQIITCENAESIELSKMAENKSTSQLHLLQNLL